MLNISKQFISYNRSSRNGSPIYIVIHDTGDAGATAQNEHDYFAGGDRSASADFFIDSDNIIQIIDTDNYYSWHCGDGGGVYGITNANSLGIEMCLGSDGNTTTETVTNTVNLVQYLMSKYGIGIDKVVRHYDASRKSCPGSFMSNSWAKWTAFKARVSSTSTSTTTIKLGWNQNSTGWWYCTDIVNKYYYKDQWKQIDGEWYSFDSQGYARQSKWLFDGGKWYWLKNSCKMAKSEWLYLDEDCYCFNESGALYVNCTTPDGYKVDESGAWVQ